MDSPHRLFDQENFNYEQLRRIIINYAIHTNDGEVSSDEVRNCRLVSSDWLQITTQALRQNREPLFHLKLDGTHCFKESEYFSERGKKLELDLGETQTPVALKFGALAARSANTYSRHLTRFRDNLVALNVYTEQWFIEQLFPEHQRFSILRNLRINCYDHHGTDSPAEPRTLSLQKVLDSCPELQTFTFAKCLDIGYSRGLLGITNDFTRLILPETLTAIDFSLQLENQHLEIMTRCSLPKLKKFTLFINRTPFEKGLIYRVLDNLKGSLEYLLFKGETTHDGRPEPLPTYFRFPVMRKLKGLELESLHLHLKLEPEIQSLETYLPELTEIGLKSQTQAMLSKWTGTGSRFEYVTKLFVTMTNDNFSTAEPEYNVNLNETVEIVQTFPNVKDFSIEFYHTGKYDALNVVWQEMEQLEKLHLSVPHPRSNRCQDEWTSVLLGIPLKMAENLRTNRIETVQNNNSIKGMENLKFLKIWGLESGRQKRRSNKYSLLSDSVFELALFEMPQLESISLEAGFWASENMTQRWKASGRKIDFYQSE